MDQRVVQGSHTPYEAFYGGLQPNDVPLYSFAAAARLVGVPSSTARWWTQGRVESGYEPVIGVVSASQLSFNELVELYVIRKLRRVHKVSLEAIRRAVEYAEASGMERPLLSHKLATFGESVLIEHLGELLDLSRGGQYALRDVIEASMRRVMRSDTQLPIALFLEFVGEVKVKGKYPVSVSPTIAFGRPTLAGTGIRTSVIAARIDAGEAVEELAYDYEVPEAYIKNAILFENAA